MSNTTYYLKQKNIFNIVQSNVYTFYMDASISL